MDRKTADLTVRMTPEDLSVFRRKVEADGHTISQVVDRKTADLTVRMTPEDLSVFRRKVEADGHTISQVVRDLIRDYNRQPDPKSNLNWMERK